MAYFVSFIWLGLSIIASLNGRDSLSDFSLATAMFFLGVAMIINAIGRIGR